MSKKSKARRKERRKGQGKTEQRPISTPASCLLEDTLGSLLDLDTEEAFEALLRGQPHLTSPEVEAELRSLSTVEGYGPPFGRLADLLARARQSPQLAWARYLPLKTRMDALQKELERDHDEIEVALERRDFDGAIAVAEDALPRAEELGVGMGISELHGQRATAYFLRESDDRAEDLELAIESFHRALDLWVPDDQGAEHLMHLGLAYSERARGDRAENGEYAVTLLRGAFEAIEPFDAPEVTAMICTNLAMVLNRRENGERSENLREAEALCERALEYRSPARDPVDWAYTQINLADTLTNLSALGLEEAEVARRSATEVIEHADHIPDWLVGSAHYLIGRSYVRATERTVEELVDADEADEQGQEAEDRKLLAEARFHLEAARDQTAGDPSRFRRTRVLDDLSYVLAELGDEEGAITASRDALAVFRPTSAPSSCMDVGARLGWLRARRGQWEEAASAYRDAVQAADIGFHLRLETEARNEEARRAGALTRWAPFAIARDGDDLGAVKALEGGRARELRRRVGPQGAERDAFADVSEQLQEDYDEALRGLASVPLGPSGAAAGRRLQEVLSAIRNEAGRDDFLAGVSAEMLASAVEADCPLIYVNPTPFGTLLIRVSVNEELAISSTFLEKPTSLDVLMRLMVGQHAQSEEPFEADEPRSYLIGASGSADDEHDFQADLDDLLPWLGVNLGLPIHTLLREVGATGATLVACGPIAAAPLHAATWRDGSTERCLLDEMVIAYAPSAALAAASRERVARWDPSNVSFVGMGDPTSDLPAAAPEVEAVANLFGTNVTAVAVGDQAQSSFLGSHAPDASYLHLACHAKGALFDTEDAALCLADGAVSASELATLELRARCVAVSACESAVAEISGLPDEVISIGTVMLAGGAACAIASLWPVDDLATALLMTRFYEVLLDGEEPPAALRRAQLWLRDLGDAEESAFLSNHPALEVEFRRRLAGGSRPGRRASGGARGSSGPYSHPDCWAPFIAIGA